jgi:hypothetical protein
MQYSPPIYPYMSAFYLYVVRILKANTHKLFIPHISASTSMQSGLLVLQKINTHILFIHTFQLSSPHGLDSQIVEAQYSQSI